ncbi:tyrosine-type recombinase/integrase [Mycolicibacterium rhodesiae]|uniref:Site-specific integrase n=1 Tax=Mycolicibacterium rhodesiae TaxID=36814 RepID=A0A1X0IRZ9_MYCRH|nr:site-specific integrase [Mycolicibacterium rhodesiae]MCV7343799.1 site-specific integrase [Mycolicibacterium rhodesiae]ORB51273.1 site-specific integrase [Mycolicibacterium rhodesiae]
MAATIRARVTKRVDKFGNPVVSYQVRWLEPIRDEFGAPTGKFKQTSETFDTERKAKAHMRKVENQLEGAAGVDPSSAKLKANTPLGTYARQYFDSLVGIIDPNTIEGYEKIYRSHIGPVFGSKPVAAITTADIAQFRASLLAPYLRYRRPGSKASPSTGLSTRSPKTVKHIVGTLKRILDVAQDDQAIAANPVIANRRRTTKRTGQPFKHHPLSANQIASVVDWIATDHVMVREESNSAGPTGSTYIRQGNDVYALAVLFTAHTGVRASELQGLQVQDVTLSDIPGTVGSIRVERTAKRKNRDWTYGTPKSDASSDRVVPLAPWLADELRVYLTDTHPFSAMNTAGNRYIPHAPLFPGRRNRYVFDWAKPVCAASLYEHYLQPACRSLKLGQVRFHDLRHTFATMNLSAGEHYMQVSKWLGHSTFVLTLTTYADYINEDEVVAPKVGRGTVSTENVVPLERKVN